MRRQALRIGLGLALGFCAAAVWPDRRPPAGDTSPWRELAALGPGTLTDDTSGRLAELVVHYRPEMGADLAAVYSQLFAQLEPGATVHVVVLDRAAFADLAARLSALGRPARARLIPEPVGHPVTGWAKDRFAAWRPADPRAVGTVLLVPPRPAATSPERLGDWSVPGKLAERSGGRLRRLAVPLVFDGGDFAAAGDLVLAGPTLMSSNPGLAALGPERAAEHLRNLVGRPVLLLGRRAGDVPEHHVNMFAMPLGGRRALVGDPALAVRLLGGSERAAERLAGANLAADLSAECAARFDRAAAELAAADLEVSRVPALPLAGAEVYGPYVTYTNVLVETAGGARRVYLPFYGLAELDRAAERAWTDLGFDVQPVEMGELWRGGGSLDCLVGVLRRG